MATDQASIANAAAIAISQMSKATDSAAKAQKKQNDYIKEFNELAKEKIGNDKDMSENQLNFTEKINEALDKVHDNYEKISVTIDKICKELYAAIDSVKIFTKETNAAAKAVKNLKNAQKGNSSIFSGFGKMLRSIGSISKGAFGVLSKGFTGFGQIVTGVLDKIKSHPLGLLVTLAVKAFKIQMKIIKTALLGSLKIATQFAKNMVGLPIQIMSSTAKIGHAFRKDVVETIGNAVLGLSEFIDVNDGLGKSIGDMTKSSALSLDKFQNVQSELVQLFGEGPGGLAALVGHAGQALKDMRQFADVAGSSITKTADNFLYFYKATQSLGMAGEDIAYITAEAVKNGESIYSALDNVLVSVNTTADSFGLDRKKMSKDFFELRKDITNFGHLSNAQLSETTAKLTQMGLSMKEAAAVFGKIDTFESAAQTSAMLSQTFGMNLDALQLLRAEKPEEIIEQFRDAMLSTGRSFDDLNRHEKSLMASHTGLSAEALKMTMNYRTLGMSYSDIQKKMKEDDPTQQQIKNLELMSGSLKKIQKTLSGDNIFKNFTNGVLESMKAASGLSPILLRVSERFEDFFVSGLKVSEKSKDALTKAFSPFTAVLEDMVGDGKNKKGLFDADKFKGTFETFTVKIGNYLEQAFDDSTDIKSLSKTISNDLNKALDFDSLNQGNTIVGKLFQSSGKLIGKLLKGFAAFGPGLVNVFANNFESLVDFLTGYGGEKNSIKHMLVKLFSLSETEAGDIYGSFTEILSILGEKVLPVLVDAFMWIQSKIFGVVVDLGMTLGKAILKGMWEGFKSGIGWLIDSIVELLPSWAQRALSYIGYDTEDSKVRAAAESKAAKSSMTSASLNENFYNQAIYGSDRTQERRIGELLALLEKEKQGAQGSQLKALNEMTEELRTMGTNFDGMFGMFSDQAEINKAFKLLGKKSIVISANKADDWFSDLFGSGQAVVQASDAGLNVTNFPPEDQLVAAKSGGPIVNAIAYAGNAANALIKGMEYLMTPSNLQTTLQPAQSSPSELKICLQVDGKTLTEVCLDNDIVGKMTQPIKGRKYIDGNIIINSAGSAVQGSSLA